MSGSKPKDPSATDIADAEEWAAENPGTKHFLGISMPPEQYYLFNHGFKNNTGQAPNFTPSLPDTKDIGPAPSGEDQISQDLPKNPALVSVEAFENWSFDQIYDAIKDASNIPTYNQGLGQNVGDAWRAVNEKIRSDRDDYDDAIQKVESGGEWTGKIHDAVWANIQAYLPEIDNLYNAVSALAVLFDTFDKTIFQTKWYLDQYKKDYDNDKGKYPHFADQIEQSYSGVAQQVMAKVYVPGINFIRDNNPAFSGKTPELNDPKPPPPDPNQFGPDGDGKGGDGKGGDGKGGDGKGGDGSNEPPPPPPPPPPPKDPNLNNGGDKDGGPKGPPKTLTNGGQDDSSGDGPPPPPTGPDGLPLPQGGGNDPNQTGADNTPPPPPPPPPGVPDPNLPDPDGSSPPPSNPGQSDSGLSSALSSGASGLSGLADSAKSLASNPGASGAKGAAADAMKNAMDAAAKIPKGAPAGMSGLDAKGPKGLSGLGGSPSGGAGGRAGVGPGVPGVAGVPVTATSKDLAVSASAPPGSNAAAGAQAGGGSGSGSPGGGGAGAGQRGQNEKEHKANKALRTKTNGELVIGDVDAVVPVIGDDQPDQNAADDGAAQAPSRTPTSADRSARQEQRREPRTVSAPEPVRRTAGT